LPELTAEQLVDLFSGHPRNLFGLDQPSIAEGSAAVLTFFNPDGETIPTEKNTRSKSKNSPFFGKTLKGQVLGILNGERGGYINGEEIITNEANPWRPRKLSEFL
jgi:dihydroorotase